MDTIRILATANLWYDGVFPNQDGTFTAMTYTKSKTFKTENGAPSLAPRNSGECYGFQHNHGKGLIEYLTKASRRRRGSQLQ